MASSSMPKRNKSGRFTKSGGGGRRRSGGRGRSGGSRRHGRTLSVTTHGGALLVGDGILAQDWGGGFDNSPIGRAKGGDVSGALQGLVGNIGAITDRTKASSATAQNGAVLILGGKVLAKVIRSPSIKLGGVRVRLWG